MDKSLSCKINSKQRRKIKKHEKNRLKKKQKKSGLTGVVVTETKIEVKYDKVEANISGELVCILLRKFYT